MIFGLLFPPPGYNLDQLSEIGSRLEDRLRPAWQTTPHKFDIETRLDPGTRDGVDHRFKVPATPGGEPTVLPPKLDHYFLVSFEGRLFHGAISADKKRVVDAIPLMNHATSGPTAPDTFAVAFQAPLFRVAGTTGDAIKVDIKGSNLDEVNATAGQLFGVFMRGFGPGNTQASPPNFSLPLDELRIVPVDEALREVGMTRRDLGLAVQAAGEGILLFRDYERFGELKDIKIISEGAFEGEPVERLLDTPIATPTGGVVDLGAVARVERILGPNQIRHVDRLRAVTLEVTPPQDLALEEAIEQVRADIETLRAGGGVAPGVDISISGSAGALSQIKTALLGDGSFLSTITCSLFLAFLVVYLLMVILFQSWTYPLVMILSVPLATFGGFLGLAIVHAWSIADRYMPVQKLDMLSILGFVILAGVVVNNAILIVHQALNFLRKNPGLSSREAIRESVRSRVRPILMSMMTSVGGLMPLVLMPGAGSELYRGLGGVVVGGLAVSTVFTMFLVPTVLSAVFDLHLTPQARREVAPGSPPAPA
ncbi:MAG: efflux RND transporter permease subunit [Akkermansiaceae bacterium]|nr:efflux RND transporter permease subunit [Akkermansiaceae bacterium]